MKLTNFFDAVEAHDDLEGLTIAVNQGGPGTLLAVRHIPSDIVTQLPADAIEEANWDVLRDILVGDREPDVLYHMTRVVGYYSRTVNWNQSKIGELRDRHNGQYGLE